MTIEIARLTGLSDLVTGKNPVPASRPSVARSTTDSTAVQSEAAVREAAAVIQDYLSGPVQPPAFSVDYLSGLNVMTVRSASNGEVVFQMPTQAALRLAQMIKEGTPAQNAIVSETA